MQESTYPEPLYQKMAYWDRLTRALNAFEDMPFDMSFEEKLGVLK
jgi:hypothetical protein